jgi:Flp pilus assembly protein TadD
VPTAPRRSALPWLALAVAAGAAFWWSTRTEPHRDAPHVAPARAAVTHDEAVAAPSERPTEPLAPTAPAPVPTEPAPARAATDADPCGDGEADTPFARPSIDDLLQLRVAELNDRVHLLLSGTGASAALREGLSGAMSAGGTDSTHALETLARAPDRVDDGFDTYVAILDVLAARALGSGDLATAVRLATLATRAAPTDSLSRVVLAIAFERRGDHSAATDTFREAWTLDPEEPAIAFALASRLRDGPDPSTAVRAFDHYLAAVPQDAASSRARARLALRIAGIPSPRTVSRSGVTVVAPASLDPATTQRALATVIEALADAARLLGIARREQLAVFVYPDRAAMHRATCAQGWTGAMFDGALHTDAETLAHPTESTVMLRHESLHAAMHPLVPHVPTWLDEGIAQYVAREEGRAHLDSYALMIREHTWVPFGTMNDAFLVIDDAHDAGLAYHQSLAMVLWLVDRRGERGIADAIGWLSSGGDPTRVLDEAGRGTLDGEGLLTFLGPHVARAPWPTR